MAKCEHNRRRIDCKECKGKNICEHNRHRYYCKECGGSQVCLHRRRRSQCKECRGGAICEHREYRDRCKECGGRSLCKYNRARSACPICNPDSAFKFYVFSAAKRKYEFHLMLEEFKALVTQPCFYCGEHGERPRGIDRWNNAIGYAVENSRPCCAICNKAKHKMDAATFVKHFQRMADYTRAVELSDLHDAIAS